MTGAPKSGAIFKKAPFSPDRGVDGLGGTSLASRMNQHRSQVNPIDPIDLTISTREIYEIYEK